MEVQIYFGYTKKLFGMLFTPDDIPKRETAFLIIHPFAEEKKSAQRTLVDLARNLSSNGIPVLMFDLQGCGDSEGDFGSIDLNNWLNNINSAVNYLKQTVAVESIGVIGVRFGCYLSLLYEDLWGGITESFLIEPILTPIEYLRKSLRQKLIKELYTSGETTSSRSQLLQDLQLEKSIDFDGYEVSGSLYRSLVEFQNKTDLRLILEKSNSIVIISIGSRGGNFKTIQDICGLNRYIVHKTIEMEPFWTKIEEVNTLELISYITNYING